MIKRTVRERPILFSGEMVRATLDGRKTQTRRVMKRNLPFQNEHGDWEWYPAGKATGFHATSGQPVFDVPQGWAHDWCPFGGHGERLWVRETFVLENCEAPLPDRPHRTEPGEWGNYLVPHYRATEPEPHIVPLDLSDSYDDRTRWTPSIFMPRWASRITLEIVDVRVERVQDITKKDAIKEGIQWSEAFPEGYTVGASLDPSGMMVGGSYKFHAYSATQCFAKLWDSLNATRGYGWDVNPWVWVVEFRQIQPGQQRLPEQKGEG